VKQPKFFLFIFTILLSFAACKKDVKVKPEDSPTILSCDLNTPTFTRTINTPDTYYDILEDMGRNILLLGQNHILKYDYQGDLLWSKNIVSLGVPQNIIQADGDNYFTTNSTIDISSQNFNQYYSDDPNIKNRELRLTHYWRTSYSYPLPNCEYSYQKVQKDFVQDPDVYNYAEKPVNNSKCYLNKVDKDGNLLWTKTFDGNYFSGKNLCETGDGNYALITLKISGFYQTVSFDKNGVFQDTVKSPIDENSITVHKFDRTGSIIWTKTLDGILISGYQSKDFLKYTPVHLVSVQNNLFIQTRTKLFVLDENGKIIQSIKPYGTDCGGTAYGLSTFNNLVYSTGASNSTPNLYRFGVIYDANGNIREQIAGNHLQGSINTLATSDGIIFNDGSGFSKADLNDNELWYTAVDDYIQCANRTCKEGMVYVSKRKEKLSLVKTDRNGLY
jgi:hypothetical protein